MRETVYRVYEVSKKYPQGKVYKDYKTLRSAIKNTEKSIYRYYKPVEVFILVI